MIVVGGLADGCDVTSAESKMLSNYWLEEHRMYLTRSAIITHDCFYRCIPRYFSAHMKSGEQVGHCKTTG
jgi:hypothetical protein